MGAWLENRKLYFLDQDEDLILAGLDARRLVELLSDPATPRWRGGTLLLALIDKVCAGSYVDTAEEVAAKGYLKQNMEYWKDAKSIRFQTRRAVLQALQEH